MHCCCVPMRRTPLTKLLAEARTIETSLEICKTISISLKSFECRDSIEFDAYPSGRVHSCGSFLPGPPFRARNKVYFLFESTKPSRASISPTLFRTEVEAGSNNALMSLVDTSCVAEVHKGCSLNVIRLLPPVARDGVGRSFSLPSGLHVGP